MILRALAIWAGILLIAIFNGGFRSMMLIPKFGEQVGHIISTLILCLLILLVTSATIKWIGATTQWAGLKVGVFWTLLTLAFEFLAGHYLFKASWEKLLADYNVCQGRIWILVLITTLAAPIITARMEL